MLWLTGWGMPDSSWDAVRTQFPAYQHIAPLYADVADPKQFYERVEKEVRSRHAEELIVVGWSMGGLLGLRLASHYPVSALVLIGTTACFTREPEERSKGWNPVILQRMKRQLKTARERVMATFAEQMLTSKERQQSVQLVEQDDHKWSLEALIAGLSYLEEEDCRSFLFSLACPSLVIHGTDDVVCPLAAGEELAKSLLHAEFVEIPGCGHAPHVFAPDVVGDSLKRMVEQLGEKSRQQPIQ